MYPRLRGVKDHHNITVALECHMVSEILVNSAAGNGLLPDGTKPLSEPMLIYQQNLLAFIQVYLYTEDSYSQVEFEIYRFEITATSPRARGK